MIVGLVAFGWTPRTLDAQQNRRVITNWEFDRFMIRVGDAESRRELLEAKLSEEIRRLDQSCRLTEAQEQKLWLAGQGDIKRFLDRVSAAKRQMETIEADPADVDKKLHPSIGQLRQEFTAGLFNDSSLFQKVLGRTLTPTQSARKGVRQSHPQFYSAVRSYVLSTTKTLDLSAAQSEALEALLFESLPRTGMTTQYQNYLIAYRVSKIPDDQFAEILDEPQLQALQSILSHARALEPFLRRQGWVEDDSHDGPRATDEH